MAKKKYNGPTWEELAECGHSPKMIEKFQHIPFNGKYDIIVATLICFARDGLCSDNSVAWSLDAHKFFLKDCMWHLKWNGKIFFKFNEPMSSDAKDLYATRGETINKKTYLLKNSGPYDFI